MNGRVARTSPDESAYLVDEEVDLRLDACEKTPMRFPIGGTGQAVWYFFANIFKQHINLIQQLTTLES